MISLERVLAKKAPFAVVVGDCLEVLPRIDSGAVDVVLTDPPYHARAMKNARSAPIKERREGRRYEFGFEALSRELRRDAAEEFARIVSRWCLVWTDLESDHLWKDDLERFGLEYVRTGTWHRTNSAPQFSGDRPAHCIEACVIAHARGAKHWNGGGGSAHYSMPIVDPRDAARVHSTPKPLPLMVKQIAQFTDPGELVCDPFCGSGTTGVAAVRAGRRFIGIERDERQADAARKRIAEALKAAA